MNQMIFSLQQLNKEEELSGIFYVIENFHRPQFVMDEIGNTKSFDNYEDAKLEADECQEGYVICF
jgi:hypothetical protein